MKARSKALIGYIFPALGGLFVTYLYNVVDGIFVGQGVGSVPLAQTATFVIALIAKAKVD